MIQNFRFTRSSSHKVWIPVKNKILTNFQQQLNRKLPNLLNTLLNCHNQFWKIHLQYTDGYGFY